MIQRIPWKRNHKCEHPSRMVFYDTESTCMASETESGQAIHKFARGAASYWTYSGGVWNRRFKERFECASDFWKCTYNFLRSRKPTWAYTYNAAFNFTMLQGWCQLDYGYLRIIEESKAIGAESNDGNKAVKFWRGKTALDGLPFILECRHNNGPLKLIDTLNYFNEPLRDIGIWVGHEQKPISLDCETHDIQFERLERNVEIIEKAILSLLNLWETEDLGNWQPTIASLAFSSFRHGKEKCQIVAHGDRKADDNERAALDAIFGDPQMDAFDITECERRSYYGGRTAVYFLGDIVAGAIPNESTSQHLFHKGRPTISGPVTVLDVNSLFPFVMREYPHPIELIEAIKSPSFKTAQRLIDEFWCCADVELDTDATAYPCKTNNGTIYQIGRFLTALAGPELGSAVARGHVRTLGNLCVYYAGKPFSVFVDYWHARRSRAISGGSRIEGRFCKLIMNSLYGKLAQKTPLWQTCGHVVPPVRWGGFIGQPGIGEPPCFMRSIAGVSQYQSAPRSCRHTFVAAAASVTSWAREYMRQLISICPSQSIVYMDTDSLFCLPVAVESLRSAGYLHQSQMGKLKDQGTYGSVRIFGLKDYELDGERVIAGLKANAEQISERLWKQVNFEGVKQIIQHDPDGTVGAKTVQFSPTATIPGHKVNWDGWCEPWRAE